MRSVHFVPMALLAGVLVAWFLWPSAPDDPRAQVLAVVDAAAEGARARDVGGVMAHVSDDFQGRGLDRRQLGGLLFRELRRGSWQGVTLLSPSVTFPSPEVADVQVRAVLARGQGLGELEADAWELALTLTREADGAWRVTRADWDRAG